MSESSSLSWPEYGRTSSFQAVQFWPLGDNSWAATRSRRLWRQALIGSRNENSYYATSFLSTLVGTCTSSSNRER
jgi:hypothetical protein